MTDQQREEATRRAIRELWLRNRPIALGRLDVVRAAVDQLADGRLGPEARAEAKSEAHKLRGILGSYGFPDGSEVVAEAEDLLDQEVDPGGPGGAVQLAARLAACARSLAADGWSRPWCRPARPRARLVRHWRGDRAAEGDRLLSD